MKITAVSYSLADQAETITEWKENLLNEIEDFISKGSEVILYPELFLLGLSDYFHIDPKTQLEKVAHFVSTDLLPSLAKTLNQKKVLVVLGSGPRVVENKLKNSAPVWIDGEWIFQDKIHLTPWEVDFTAGSQLQSITFKDLKVAVLICYDIEMPGIALRLKKEQVHLVLVPSATANRNGNQRINRCASGRSVELGAAILTVPLVGDSACELVDHSEGRQGLFLPSQEAIIGEQEYYSAYSIDNKVIAHYDIDIEILKMLKVKDDETKPYLKQDILVKFCLQEN
jgi:predicted amidohydrolase